MTGKCNYHSVIYKATRLLSILIGYENEDLEYLDYEIRSYKRAFAGKGRLLKIENLLFKVIKINPDFNTRKKNELIWHTLASSLQAIQEDKYEGQILKYFDFTEWIHNKLEK